MRVGIVGVGRFGRLHLNVLKQIPGCEVVAVADIDEALVNEVAAKFDIGLAFGDPKQLICSDEIDAVDIVSDESTHGPLAILALQHGKHVFIEKPIATSFAEAQEIERLAHERKRVVMVGNISRFGLPYHYIHKYIQSGALGAVGHIRAKRDFSREWFEHFGKRVHPVYESGIHDLDLILWYVNSRCTEVYALERRLSGNVYPDLFTALLTFENGIIATLSSAWLVPRQAPQNLVQSLELGGTIDAHIEIVGSKSSAKFDTLNTGLTVSTDSGYLMPDYILWPDEQEETGGAIRAELRHFIRQAERNEPSPIAPLSHAVESLRIADAIVRSAGEGAPVRLE
ncbi:Gfo/Idh/MocA family protein [Paenibacillus sp. GCM10027626]|uniref:Gfo/Idh/MocA family protein n=1 Tax=Paenibacillus sp. GCM10027626 TaxID=3273411 RepID=UPI0036441684